MIKRYKLKSLSPVDAFFIGLICLLILVFIPLFCLCPLSQPYSYHFLCSNNLSRIGRAMLFYAQDYDDQYPRAGGPQSVWTQNVMDWKAKDKLEAYGLEPDGTGGQVSISASLYLLVKYVELEPSQFICKNEKKVTEFKPSNYGLGDRDRITLWDFGPDPQKHISYAYHLPFGNYTLATSSDPGMAVAADRNPWIDSPFAKSKNFNLFDPNSSRESIKAGNSRSHKDDSQNVLFMDGHVGFERDSFCGIDDDNIYTSWDSNDKARGTPPKLGSQPASELDSLLVNDPP